MGPNMDYMPENEIVVWSRKVRERREVKKKREKQQINKLTSKMAWHLCKISQM